MGKSYSEVIALFNEQVNMTAEELEAWLDDPQSRKAGTGVGIESGHRIVEILRKNPGRKPDAYDEEDITHMRKVVSYNSRHLAQEDHLKETKTTEELEKAKSTISLKNWGHDPVKVKLERDAKSVSDDNRRGADEDTDDICIRAQDGLKVGEEEEEADGLGETESARVSGTESESVEEDVGIGSKRKRRPSSAATHRNGENTGGEEKDSSRIERNKRLHKEKDDSDSESSRG